MVERAGEANARARARVDTASRAHRRTGLRPDGRTVSRDGPPPPTSSQFAAGVDVGSKVALRDRFSNLVAVLDVASKWVPDKEKEAREVLGTTDESHPGVGYLMNKAGTVYLGGSVQALARPHHYDFASRE